MLSVPKFLSAMAVSAMVALSLVACSPSDGDTHSVGCEATPSGSHSKSVTVSGEFGKEPKVTMPAAFDVTTTERTVLITGKGEPAVAGESVAVHYAVYNAATSERIDVRPGTSWDSDVFAINDTAYPGMLKSLSCARAGDRIVSAIPSSELFGLTGTDMTEVGIGATDTLVFIFDVDKVTPAPTGAPSAEPTPLSLPTPEPWVDNVPTVDFSGDVPVVTLPDTAPSPTLQVKVLKEGDGALVTAFTGVTVTIDYQGTSWNTGDVFDQSFGGAPATFPVSGVVQGFAAAMVNQKVGSTVLVTIPPEYAYGPEGSGHRLSGQTLVFLIEIHGVK